MRSFIIKIEMKLNDWHIDSLISFYRNHEYILDNIDGGDDVIDFESELTPLFIRASLLLLLLPGINDSVTGFLY